MVIAAMMVSVVGCGSTAKKTDSKTKSNNKVTKIKVEDSDLLDADGNKVGDASVDTSEYLEILKNISFEDYTGYTVTANFRYTDDKTTKDEKGADSTTYISRNGYYSVVRPDITKKKEIQTVITSTDSYISSDGKKWFNTKINDGEVFDSLRLENRLPMKLGNFLPFNSDNLLSCVFINKDGNNVQLNLKLSYSDKYKVYKIKDSNNNTIYVDLYDSDNMTYTDEDGKEIKVTADEEVFNNCVVNIDTKAKLVSDIIINNSVAKTKTIYKIDNTENSFEKYPSNYTKSKELDDMTFSDKLSKMITK